MRKEVLDKLTALENTIAIMPGHVYWMNTEGIYLGCNDNQARSIGFSSRHQIIGKCNTEIRGFLIPEALDPINNEVMKKGKTITIEEPAVLDDGSIGTFLSTKTPFYNSHKEILGMVGISIDITAHKKHEKLEEQLKRGNKVYGMKRFTQERLRAVAEQAVHDIRSPLINLSMIVESCRDVLELEQVFLRDVARMINDIANHLNYIKQVS